MVKDAAGRYLRVNRAAADLMQIADPDAGRMQTVEQSRVGRRAAVFAIGVGQLAAIVGKAQWIGLQRGGQGGERDEADPPRVVGASW